MATILVVDDDEAMLALIVTVLQRVDGWRCLTATRAEYGLAYACAIPGRIDALVSDVIMPGMSGTELARVLSEERPGIGVLLISGSPRAGDERWPLLTKPFKPSELVASVGFVIERSLVTLVRTSAK